MHARSCLLAGALVSPVLIKCTEEGWCWIRFASHPRNSVCSSSCFWPQTLLWFLRMKQHLKAYLGSSRKTFSPSALHGKSWQGSKVAQWHPAGGLRKGWKSAPTLLGAPSRFSLRSHPVPRSSVAFLGASPLFPRCRISGTTISSVQSPGSESQGEAKPPWHQGQSQVSAGITVTQIMKNEK